MLDPWGDHEIAGYLRNIYKEKDPDIIRHLELAAFQEQVSKSLSALRKPPVLLYQHITQAHKRLFGSLYPWAGQDRARTAPNIAISKAGINNMFAHPLSIRLAADQALTLGQNISHIRKRPGQVYGYLAFAHPFLEGNGRTILTVFAELSRRATFYVRWEYIPKRLFLQMLTTELLQPGTAFDELLLQYVEQGQLSSPKAIEQLRVNFNRPTDEV